MTSESECSSTETIERTHGELVPHAGLQREVLADLRRPATLVSIGLNSPRNSVGASGLRSYMSMCDGPPGR